MSDVNEERLTLTGAINDRMEIAANTFNSFLEALEKHQDYEPVEFKYLDKNVRRFDANLSFKKTGEELPRLYDLNIVRNDLRSVAQDFDRLTLAIMQNKEVEKECMEKIDGISINSVLLQRLLLAGPPRMEVLHAMADIKDVDHGAFARQVAHVYQTLRQKEFVATESCVELLGAQIKALVDKGQKITPSLQINFIKAFTQEHLPKDSIYVADGVHNIYLHLRKNYPTLETRNMRRNIQDVVKHAYLPSNQTKSVYNIIEAEFEKVEKEHFGGKGIG